MKYHYAHRVGLLWFFLFAFGSLWVCGANALFYGRNRLGLILCGIALVCFVAGITANIWSR